MSIKERIESPGIKKGLRWDLVGMVFTALLAILLIFILDTGSVAEWIAKRKHTKIDEIAFTGIALLAALGWFSTRKWLRLSRQLVGYAESPLPAHLPETNRVRTAQRRDLVAVGLAILASFIAVFFFDTGSLAEWIAKHKESKVDEVIVTGVILLVGLLFFSTRRWFDLTDQVVKYEELHRKTSKLNREITLLGELSESLQSCLSADEAHQLIAASAQVLFPGSSGAVYVIASSRDIVEVVTAWGDPSLSESHFEPRDCWALRRGRLHRRDADTASLACAHLGKSSSARSMCVPMMAHGEALGLLYLDTESSDLNTAAISSESFGSEERLARTFAEQSALALANLNMRDVLKMQSIRDPLTGLFNRRYMEESLDRELKRVSRQNSSLGVLMIDVDHFKNLNDTFGHEAGDAVLRALGSLLKTHFREEDIVCRYGGEEFTVILPEMSAEVVQKRTSDLCEVIKQMSVQHRGQPLRSVTLSIGVAMYGEQGTTADSLLRAADSALYLAKKQGRNQVVIASARSEHVKGASV
jgi:diguanylate cyclase (GGDEF)-like protein